MSFDIGSLLSPLTAQSQSAFNAATNRLTASLYDTSGNQTQDSTGRTFGYDAENRQTSFNGGTATYSYDGEGHRVKKVDASGTTVYVYDVGDRLIAEYTSGTPTGSGTSYFTSDHLGSTRLVTKADGTVKARYDYLPFGEELGAGVGQRTTALGYGAADNTTKKFTSKERDSESGLDYFLARYYSSAQGRFTSPDEFGGGPRDVFMLGSGDKEKQALPYADITNPQSLNKYHYALNNPLKYVDPDGHQDGFHNRFETIHGQMLRGEITEEQYWQRLRGEGYGAMAGVAIVGGFALGLRSPQIVQAILLWAARNPDKAIQVAEELVQISTGNPAPGRPGTLTISTATRLTVEEISTGARLAKQTGAALVQSGHIGAEFVNAAGQTFDAMGTPQAYRFFGNGADFFKSIVHHLNKSVDFVAIDLKGASEAQIKTIKGFVSGLSKKQQGKIIYVTE